MAPPEEEGGGADAGRPAAVSEELRRTLRGEYPEDTGGLTDEDRAFLAAPPIPARQWTRLPGARGSRLHTMAMNLFVALGRDIQRMRDALETEEPAFWVGRVHALNVAMQEYADLERALAMALEATSPPKEPPPPPEPKQPTERSEASTRAESGDGAPRTLAKAEG